jgi:polar amino acid transport system substrate-binding protein
MLRKAMVIFTALALALALCLPAAAGPVLDRIEKSGVLRVGSDPTYPPLAMKAKDGQIIGFEIDLMKFLASALKVKLKIEPMPFNDLLPALKAGKVDLVIAGMTITAKRNTQAIFVGPYLLAGQAVLTRVKSAQALRGMADLNKASIRVAAAKGSTGEMTVKQLLPKARYTPAANQEAALKLLLARKVDAVAADYPFCAVAAFRYRSQGIIATDKPFTFEPLGIALSPDDPLLANLLRNFLLVMEGSGQKQRLEQRWFKNGDWISRLPK